jgi:VIT1/CCC1 family predicted Fe2+/Mn2+ transporter
MTTALLRWGAFVSVALAIIAGAFAPVLPDWVGSYLKAAVVAFTGLAGLFMHPPGTNSSS